MKCEKGGRSAGGTAVLPALWFRWVRTAKAAEFLLNAYAAPGNSRERSDSPFAAYNAKTPLPK